MKKLILTACAALLLPLAASAGEVTAGSVPGTLNYQGRLERDNAPITGPIHLYFRIFNSPTANNSNGGACGGVAQPCLWQSPEITVQATQGIFSADMYLSGDAVPVPVESVLARGGKFYLEVQVESDVLAPREPMNSVAFALLAKRLEDGASVSVTTLTALNNVVLSSAPGAYMTVGTETQSSAARMTVNGWLKLTSGGIIFPDNSSMNVASVASAGNIASDFDADILADRDGNGSGDVLMRKPGLTYMRITNTGKVGIGSAFTADGGANPPNSLLDVDGALYVGNEGIYDRDDAELNVKQDLLVEGGKITGMNSENISLGETNDIISFNFNGNTEKMRLHSNGYLGVGLAAPAAMVHAAGDIQSNTGVRGGVVSVGAYGGAWTGAANEVRAQNNSHLLLQQTNSYNVGIGTDTPREKLHVRGSIRSDYGVLATTAAFGSDVRVNGKLTANSGLGNTVELSSTTIYGTLQVTGGIGSLQGIPAYLTSTQTFSGLNTFQNQLTVSSDIVTLNRVGAGVSDFDFPGTKYLQVGDNKGAFVNDNAAAYLVGGANADAKLNFYRGPSEIARVETQTGAAGAGLAQVVGGQTKIFTDTVYHHIFNSAVWISTGYNTTPAVFVSSWMGNVGIGTSVPDPNWRMTVNGSVRLTGSGAGIFFNDGTSLTTGNLGALLSAGNISNNNDAVVQSDADLSGSGDVILRAGALDGLALKPGGNIGVGTLFPQAKLNVRGDVMIGNTFNPYGGDSSDDLVVAGNIAFDGELVQRSVVPVKLSKLIVADAVYLSTTAGTRTGIGNVAPGYTLDVTGDINAAGSLYTGGTARISNAGVVGSGGLNASWDGNTVAVNRGGTGATSFTAKGGLYGNNTGAIGATAALTDGMLMIGNSAGNPLAANLTGTSNQVNVANGNGSITLSLPQSIDAAASPTFAGVTLTGLTSGGILYGGGAGGIGATAVLTNGQLLIGDGAGAPTAATLTQASANQVRVANAAGSITLSLPQDIDTGARPAFASVTTTSSGTFKNSGAANYSIETSSGILVNAGVINMTGGKVVNLADPDVAQDGATKAYVDAQAGGSGGLSWSKTGNFVTGGNFVGSNNNADVVFQRWLSEKLRLTSAGVTVSGDASVTGNVAFTGAGTVDGYDISASGPNWDTAYTHSQAVTGAEHGAVSGNSINMIVRRDGSGNFSAGTITAALTGNASTAAKLQTARNLNGASFDGSADQTIPVNSAENTASSGYLLWSTGINGNSQAKTTSAKLTFNAATGVLSATGFSGPLTGDVTGNVSGNAGGNAATATTASALANTAAAGNSAITAINSASAGSLGVGRGGTGSTSYTPNRVVMSDGAGTAFLSASGGVTGTYTVARTTTTTGSPCNQWTFENGVVTAIGANISCP